MTVRAHVDGKFTHGPFSGTHPRWMFLRPDKASRYIEVYEGLREEGWKELVPSTTRRQFSTAREILDRMNSGQQGVLLASRSTSTPPRLSGSW